MAYDLTLIGSDSVAAMLECAKRGMPGPVAAEGCEDHCHVVVLGGDDDGSIRERLYDWYAENSTLLDAQECAD